MKSSRLLPAVNSRPRARTFLVVAIVGLLGVDRSLSGQDAKKKEDAAKSGGPAKKKTPPIFFLRDGSKVAGFATFDALHVKTKYGILKVPTSDLLRVKLIPRVDAKLDKKIQDQIDRLGSDDFDEREDAMDKLREFGAPAIAAIRKAARSGDEETKNRAEILTEEIQSNIEESETGHGDEIGAASGEADEVFARRFKITGQIQEETFTVKTRYGELEFQVGDILGVDFRTGGKIAQFFSVAGNRTTPNNWVSTKATLTKGQRLSVKASGNLHVSNYSLTVGPGGTTRYGSSTLGNLPMLSLVGKIGKKGKPFLIGPNYKGKAKSNGTLYLGVVPFRRNYAATGTYKVKVEAQ